MVFLQGREQGSSPRMRGAHDDPHWFGSSKRIIPAYAGSTVLEAHAPAKYLDHPRVCGEHHPVIVCAMLADGSSPRMRGAQVRSAPVVLQGRIIPAYAGSTPWVPVG